MVSGTRLRVCEYVNSDMYEIQIRSYITNHICNSNNCVLRQFFFSINQRYGNSVIISDVTCVSCCDSIVVTLVFKQLVEWCVADQTRTARGPTIISCVGIIYYDLVLFLFRVCRLNNIALMLMAFRGTEAGLKNSCLICSFLSRVCRKNVVFDP